MITEGGGENEDEDLCSGCSLDTNQVASYQAEADILFFGPQGHGRLVSSQYLGNFGLVGNLICAEFSGDYV